MLKVVEAIWVKNFVFYVELDDETAGVVDFKPLTERFELFRDIEEKERHDYFAIECGTIVWENGADIAPEWIKDNIGKIDVTNMDRLVIKERRLNKWNAELDKRLATTASLDNIDGHMVDLRADVAELRHDMREIKLMVTIVGVVLMVGLFVSTVLLK